MARGSRGSPAGRGRPTDGDRRRGTRSAADGRFRLDADRRHRVRRPADAHRAAAPPGRRARAVDRSARVRGCARGLQPAARPRLDPAGDLPRPARRRALGRGGRRSGLHRAGGRPDHSAVGRVPGRVAARVGARPRRRGGRRGCRGRGQRSSELGRPEPQANVPAGALVRLRGARPCLGGADRPLPGAGAAWLRSDRARDRPRVRRPVAPSQLGPRDCAPGRGGRRRGWARRIGVGSVQGRGAVLRRRLRDHPADAGRRGPHVPLDDLVPVPGRGRTRPDHSRPRSSPPSPRSATRRTASAAGRSRH